MAGILPGVSLSQPPTTKKDEEKEDEKEPEMRDDKPKVPPSVDENLDKWKRLRNVADRMCAYKHSGPDHNTWQAGQHGGYGKPFYYPSKGIAEGINFMIEAEREVYRRIWGHRNCDLIEGAGLSVKDQWVVEKDW